MEITSNCITDSTHSFSNNKELTERCGTSYNRYNSKATSESLDQFEGSFSKSYEKRRREIKNHYRKPTRRSRGSVNLLLWSHFTKMGIERVQCNICSEVTKTPDSSTSPLHSHLKRRHKAIYTDYLLKKHTLAESNKEETKIPSDGFNAERSLQLSTKSHRMNISKNRDPINDYDYCNENFRKQKYSSQSKAQISKDLAIIRFLAVTNQPLSMVDDPGFIRFVETLDPRCVVKSKVALTRTKYPFMEDSVKNALVQFLTMMPSGSDVVDFTAGTSVENSEYDMESQERGKAGISSGDEESMETCYRIDDDTVSTRMKHCIKGISEYYGKKFNQQKYQSQGSVQLTKDMAIMTFIASTNQPFSLVEEPEFVRFVEALDPHCAVKSRTTFSRRKCPLLYENVKAAVNQVLATDLPTCGGVAFTTDTWTSRSNDPYESLTLHYINRDFQLRKFVIDCRSFEGQKTEAELCNTLNTMIKAIPGLDKNCYKYAVNDSARDIFTALQKSFQNHGLALKCFDHILKNAVAMALSRSPLDECIKICCDLSSSDQRSCMQLGKIKELCSECEPPVHYRGIVQIETTRWNSFYYCLESIMELKQPLLKAQQTSPDFTLKIPTVAEFKMLEDIRRPLKDIVAASEAISVDTKPTIHLAMLHMATLGNIENKYCDASEITKKFCADFNSYLQYECPNGGKDVYEYCLAHFLHPKYKGALLRRNRDTETFKCMLDRLVKEHSSWEIFQRELCGVDFSTRNMACKKVGESTWEEELDILTRAEMEELPMSSEKEAKSNLEVEIDRYLHETPMHDSAVPDILDWWSRRRTEFPLLCEIARRILCIPVSNSASESLFSASGNIVTPQRTRLDPENLEKLVYIHENYDKVQIVWKLKPSTSDGLQPPALSKQTEAVASRQEDVDKNVGIMESEPVFDCLYGTFC